MAPTVIDTQTAAQQVAQETVPADAKVNDLSMLLSILSSIFLIVRS